MLRLAAAGAIVIMTAAAARAQVPPPAAPDGVTEARQGLNLEGRFPADGWIVTPVFYPGDIVACSAMFHGPGNGHTGYYVAFADGTAVAELRYPGEADGEIWIFSFRLGPDWSALSRNAVRDGQPVLQPLGEAAARRPGLADVPGGPVDGRGRPGDDPEMVAALTAYFDLVETRCPPPQAVGPADVGELFDPR